MVAVITFDPDAFRAQFPPYANTACYPNTLLQGYWDTATVYMTPDVQGCGGWTEAQQTLGLNLMTAHLAYIFASIAKGQAPAMMTSAQIDKVSVAVKPPPVQEGSQFQYWLGTSPWGVQLLALMNIATAGGFYIGGLPERAAFRRVGGGFGGVPPNGWGGR